MKQKMFLRIRLGIIRGTNPKINIMLFPPELIKHTVGFGLKHKKNHFIYLIVLLTFICGLTSLPFIKIDITFQSRGAVTSTIQNNAVTSSVSTKISAIYLAENTKVKEKDTLLILDTKKLEEQITFNQTKLVENKDFILDLINLTNSKRKIITPLFKKEVQQYNQHLRGLKTKLSHFKREYKTSKNLFNKDVIPKQEYLLAKHKVNSIKSEILDYKSQQKTTWQVKLQNYYKDTTRLLTDIKLLEEEKTKYVILAPISGTIKNYTGIKAGNFVIPNQTLAEISPNDNLIVECYVSPSEIGYLKTGLLVNFQIDAYNYNQWGMAKGKVIEIFENVNLINKRPYFRVRCELLTKEMKLKSGYVGEIKKDMTLTGRFMVTKRTLWELLFDKMDDWLNPKTSSL